MEPRERLSELAGSPGARERLLAFGVAILAGVAVYAIARSVFPYHSSNHDEAVYLQQASMLLAGQLELYAGDLAGAFRPWFFVEDGGRLYPKYTPYPAALYAAAMGLFGQPRIALAATATANVALVYVLAVKAFDRRIGLVAAAVFAAAPLSIVSTSVFLPYAPTTTLNLLFAGLYLHGVRGGGARSAAGAGLSIGLAFFARPYTAVLFAAPFVLHALFEVARAAFEDGLRPLPGPVRRHAATAAGGLGFVGLTLAYNARVTGAPLEFPYAAFAPRDGPGFGTREILAHSVEYTPRLAAEANGYVLWYLLTRWFTAGAVGTLVAAVGLAVFARRLWRREGSRSSETSDPTAGCLLAGLLVSIPLGNLAFWGNYNVLGTMSDPADGLIAQFGPIYHFDLLAPLSVFAAVGAVAGLRALRERLAAEFSADKARVAVAVVLVVSLPMAGIANAGLVAEPLERNAAYTDSYETAYEPFEPEPPKDAVVFLPTPYGEWQAHPFQALRNEPGLNGPTVYALDRGPGENFAVIDAYPNRSYYRYSYRGEWTPNPYTHVDPKLEPLVVRSGDRLDTTTTVGVPERVDRARVRLSVDGDDLGYTVEAPPNRLRIDWTLTGEGASLEGTTDTHEYDGDETVVLTVTLVAPGGGTLTYRQEAAVRADGDRTEVVWPPERTVCPLVTDCGLEGTYLPERPEQHREWVVFETDLEAEER
jgi:hypothetical protein